MRPSLSVLTALAASFALTGCADVYWGMERQHYATCQRNPTADCFGNGYLRAGAAILEDPNFGHPPLAPSDLGEPAPLIEATAR